MVAKERPEPEDFFFVKSPGEGKRVLCRFTLTCWGTAAVGGNHRQKKDL